MEAGLAVKIKVSHGEDVFMMATNSDGIKFNTHGECGHSPACDQSRRLAGMKTDYEHMTRSRLEGDMRKQSPLLVATAAAILASSMTMAGDVLFTEVTDEVGIDFEIDTPPKWILNNSHFYGGVGVADFDGNGAVDLFFSGVGNTNDTLYLNDGAGNFTDVSAEWGLDDMHFSCGVGAGDIDNDGWIDIVVGSAGPASIPGGSPGGYRLYKNINGTRFEDIAESAGVHEVAPGEVQHPTFATPGDFNADGHLDLMYGSWQVPADGNKFYLNDGDGTFTDVTKSMGFYNSVRPVKGFSASVVDMDGDLNPDIVWVADFGKSAYFRNNGDGTFTDLTPGNGTGVDASGMGSAILDFNKDGKLDWFVGAIYYEDGTPFAKYNGNALYMQIADHTFANIAEPFGILDSGWSWSSIAADLDNDGLEEIIVGNGSKNNAEFRDELEYVFQQNNINGTFYNVTSESGIDLACQATSSAAFDMEGDGDLDLVFVCNDGAAHIYRNDSTNQGSWLQIELGGDPANGIPNHGFNTRVEARVGSVVHTRYMDGRPSYGASGPQALHFGLGDTEVVDELTIRWINGDVDVMEDVPVNQVLVVSPIDAIIGDLNEDGLVNGTDLAVMLGQWGACVGDPELCIADLDSDGFVNGADLSLVLGNWSLLP